MTDDSQATENPVFSLLEELCAEPPDEAAKVLPCVQITLHTRATFDIYRARRVPKPMTMWEVRGFYTDADNASVERRAVLLGTRDGQAMLRDPSAMASGAEPGGMVKASTRVERRLDDLAQVIASAVRKLLEQPN